MFERPDRHVGGDARHVSALKPWRRRCAGRSWWFADRVGVQVLVFFWGMGLYPALKGYSCGNRGFREDRRWTLSPAGCQLIIEPTEGTLRGRRCFSPHRAVGCGGLRWVGLRCGAVRCGALRCWRGAPPDLF